MYYYHPKYDDASRPFLAAAKSISRAVGRGFEKVHISFKFHVDYDGGEIKISTFNAQNFFAAPFNTRRRARIVANIMPHVIKLARRARRVAGFRGEVVINLSPWGCEERWKHRINDETRKETTCTT